MELNSITLVGTKFIKTKTTTTEQQRQKPYNTGLINWKKTTNQPIHLKLEKKKAPSPRGTNLQNQGTFVKCSCAAESEFTC